METFGQDKCGVRRPAHSWMTRAGLEAPRTAEWHLAPRGQPKGAWRGSRTVKESAFWSVALGMRCFDAGGVTHAGGRSSR